MTAGGFLLLALLLLNTARQKSMVYDEIIYPAVGAVYWQSGDWRWNREHPPLQKLASGLPLLTQDLAFPTDASPETLDPWRLGYRLFFNSPAQPQRLLLLSRLPTILLTLALAFLLWRWGGPAALFVLALDPLVLGNGALALNDIFVTTFMFLAVYGFYRWSRGETRALWWCGLAGGAAVASKFSGLLLGPIFVMLSLILLRRGMAWQRVLTGLGVTFAVASTLLLAFYKFDPALLKAALSAGFQFHDGDNSLGFLLVPIGAHSGWYYYPLATLIKTPLPLLIFWALGLFALWKRAELRERRPFVLVPVLMVWAAALTSSNHFGVRYLLPATPFLALAAGWGCAAFLSAHRRAIILLFVWLGAEAALTHPHHMAYFNELIGGSKNGYKWLDGSNQDWGQDLPALANFLKQEGNPPLLLSYMGSGRPEAWGIRYQDVLSPAITSAFHEDVIWPAQTEREYLAVSAGLRAKPPWKEVFSWLDERKPAAVLGYTLFVYDITQDPEAAGHLADIYRISRRPALEARQRSKVF